LGDGFSFQTGAGSVSLATAAEVGREMTARSVTGSFACGGTTGFHVQMLEAGLFRSLMDVQCFDLAAVESFSRNANHMAMSASAYAGPHVGGAVVDRLSAVVLGAAEVDTGFNVNVTTRTGGQIIGGSGGHCDAAQGAELTLITTRLTAAGYPKIAPSLTTLTTPGATVDVVMTEAGIAVNPARAELADRLHHAGLTVLSIDDMARRASEAATRPIPPSPCGRIVAISEYRDGTVTDVIRQIEGK
jgi:citrate lyase subunit alpha/citrate CoA-transferase